MCHFSAPRQSASTSLATYIETRRKGGDAPVSDSLFIHVEFGQGDKDAVRVQVFECLCRAPMVFSKVAIVVGEALGFWVVVAGMRAEGCGQAASTRVTLDSRDIGAVTWIDALDSQGIDLPTARFSMYSPPIEGGE